MKKGKREATYGILAVLLGVASVFMTFSNLNSNELSIQEILMGEFRVVVIPFIAILIICVIGICAYRHLNTKHKERIEKFLVFAQVIFLVYLCCLGIFCE